VSLSTSELEDIYRRRYSGFRRAVAALTGDDQLGHDAVQEGFALALRKRRQFRGGSAESWIWRIVVNKASDLRRRRGQGTVAFGPVGDEYIRSERDPVLAAAIGRLPPRRRLMVFFRYYADLSYADIAELCGVSEGTVGATLAAAHEELAAAMQTEGVEA
jgi:RNA polymerase sigma-70 factor (ECF subfamily)